MGDLLSRWLYTWRWEGLLLFFFFLFCLFKAWFFIQFLNLGQKVFWGTFLELFEVCIWWRRVGGLPVCGHRLQQLYQSQEIRTFGVIHSTLILRLYLSLYPWNLFPYMSCLPHFPGRFTEFTVYSVADDHIWSHLTMSSSSSLFLSADSCFLCAFRFYLCEPFFPPHHLSISESFGNVSVHLCLAVLTLRLLLCLTIVVCRVAL